MKIESLMITLSHGCNKGIVGKYTIKTETAYIDAYDIKDECFDIKKAIFKCVSTLKSWDDNMEISIRREGNFSFTRVWFIGCDYSDRENGTLTIARCSENGTFELEDRKHKAHRVIKNELGMFIDSMEFVQV